MFGWLRKRRGHDRDPVEPVPAEPVPKAIPEPPAASGMSLAAELMEEKARRQAAAEMEAPEPEPASEPEPEP